jgi:hypothetical protein
LLIYILILVRKFEYFLVILFLEKQIVDKEKPDNEELSPKQTKGKER